MEQELREYTEHELYIQLVDGAPHEHPILGDNFRAAFPDVDPENLPADRFARFVRVHHPEVKTFEVAELTYDWVDGVVKDIWTIRPMTGEEEAEKREQMAAEAYAIRDGFVQQCQNMIAQVTEPTGNQVWREVMAEFLTWQIESVDPIMPSFPRLPFRTLKGEWRKVNN
jgi:hypothetical protein